MLIVTCSKCGSKRSFKSLEALVGARFCDACGQPSTLVQANVSDLLPYLETGRSKIIPQAGTERTEKHAKLQALIEEASARQRALESKCHDLTIHERELNQRISDKEKKLQSEEENLQQLSSRTTTLHIQNQSLENDHKNIRSEIEEKSERLRELEARIDNSTKRETETVQNTTIQQTKLKTTQNELEQINNHIRELNQERQSLEAKNQELSKAAEEKTNLLSDLKASLEELQQQTQDLNKKVDGETKLIAERETKLKSVGQQIESINDRVRELENTTMSLEKRRQELEETNSRLVNQNQDLDKLLHDKHAESLEPKVESMGTPIDQEALQPDGIPDAVARREAQSLEWLGIVAKHRNQYARSEVHFRTALEIRERLGDERDVAFTLGLLLELTKERKEYAKARDYALKAQKIHRRMGDKGDEKRISDELNSIRELEESTSNMTRG